MNRDWKSLVEKQIQDYGFEKLRSGYWIREFEESRFSPENRLLVAVNVTDERVEFGADYVVEKNDEKRYIHVKNFSYRYDGNCFTNQYVLIQTIEQFVKDAFDSREKIVRESERWPDGIYLCKKPKASTLFI